MSDSLLAWFLTYAIIATCDASSLSQAPTCTSIATVPGQKSSALLQVGKTTYSHVLRLAQPNTGESVPLTEEGYDSVVALCCAKEMIDFMTRLIGTLKLQICHPGGLPGLALFHDCPDDKNSFSGLLADLNTGQEGDCPFLIDDSRNCPALAESCPSFPSATLPPCGDQTTTAKPSESQTTAPPVTDHPSAAPDAPPPSAPEAPTTTAEPPSPKAPDAPPPSSETPAPSSPAIAPGTCCQPVAALLLNNVAIQRHRKTPAGTISKVKRFDCAKYPGAIQVIKEKNKGGYDVKQLDISTGKYNFIYQIPFTQTNPEFKNLNGVAINPIDGIAYGILTVDDKKKGWLVRFDDTMVEFVAHVKAFSVVGAFSSYGDYYYIAYGLNVARQVGSMEGFSSYTDTLADFSSEPKIAEVGVAVQDLIAYTGNIEGTSTPTEYIIALDKSDKLLVVKDAGQQSQSWLLATTGCGETKGFGAGWNFKGRVYFSGNTGAGVYEVPMATMNVNAGSVMLKRVGDSETTSRNDGMNCMDVASPFPPPTEEGCGSDYKEVPAGSDGSCPDGSFRA